MGEAFGLALVEAALDRVDLGLGGAAPEFGLRFGAPALLLVREALRLRASLAGGRHGDDVGIRRGDQPAERRADGRQEERLQGFENAYHAPSPAGGSATVWPASSCVQSDRNWICPSRTNEWQTSGRGSTGSPRITRS